MAVTPKNKKGGGLLSSPTVLVSGCLFVLWIVASGLFVANHGPKRTPSVHVVGERSGEVVASQDLRGDVEQEEAQLDDDESAFVQDPVTPESMREAAIELIERAVGSDAAKKFNVVLIPRLGDSDMDWFEIHDGKAEGSIILRGTNGVSVASALNWYLRYYCKVDTSWMSPFPLEIPPTLPPVGSKGVKKTALVQWGYYENVCTFSYTQAWWGWDRWEREIDWMAMSGINLPLSLTGQEYVMARVFRQFGLAESHIQDYFTGPAFLAWNRMINIRKWAGPLTRSWLEGQRDLQRKILKRERALGMTPVLPAFAGGVPEAMQHLYPQSHFTRHGNWGGFERDKCCVMQVAPTDELFGRIGKAFVEAVTRVYGTDHIYSCDTFNENRPGAGHGQVAMDFLTQSSRAVFSSMEAADAQAIWLMQGWLFMNDARFWGEQQLVAYLNGVPEGKMIILDLFTDVFPVWKRKDLPRPTPIEQRTWIWNMLHSFGGNSGMYGRMQVVSKDPMQAKSESKTMQGVGITTEGIEQNPAVYEMMAETRWHREAIDVRAWIKAWAERRLGPKASDEREALAKEAWELMADSVYSCKTHQMGQVKSMMEIRPRLDAYSGFIPNSDFMPIRRHYKDSVLVEAWEKLVQSTAKAGDKYHLTPAACFDLADVTRQVLSDLYARLFVRLMGFVHRHIPYHRQGYNVPGGHVTSVKEAEAMMQKLEDLIRQVDELVGTQPHMLLGKWIDDARRWGQDEQEADHLEFNARNVITLWGPRGEIADYASKQWSGLLSDYYLPRWSLFFQYVRAALQSQSEFDQPAFQQALLAFEQEWGLRTTPKLPAKPNGDVVALVKRIDKEWGPLVRETMHEDVYDVPLPPLVRAPGADVLAEQLEGRT